MATVDIETLHRLPLLKGASRDMVERLAEVAIVRSFRSGQVIFEEASSGRELYIVESGRVEVTKGQGAKKTALATRGPGGFIGEMGFLEGSPRFATVRALEPTRAFEFREHELRAALNQQPQLLYQVIRVLSARLRESDQRMIVDLQHKNQELARAYLELKDAQAALAEKERLEHELELARELQQSILPQEFPNVRGVSCAARSRPAQQVGGDFYDVIPLSKGRVGLVMADVAGKGMAAALYMALARSLIHAEAKHSSSPRQVLLRVHRLLMEMSQADMFVTVFYGVLDPAQGVLRYARAGHDHPLLFSPSTGESRSLDANGVLLGLVNKVTLEEANVQIEPGDFLVLYTDGITDANSRAGEFFGMDRLRKVVRAVDDRVTAQGLCDLIFDRADLFQAGALQYDDMAVLVMKAMSAD